MLDIIIGWGAAAVAAIGAFLGLLTSYLRVAHGGKSLPEVLSKLPARWRRLPVIGNRATKVLDRYQEDVLKSHALLRFGDPTASVQNVDDALRMHVIDIYTPLSVAWEPVSQGDHPLVNQPVRTQLSAIDALKTAEAHRSIILGGPGAGKSTLIDILVRDDVLKKRYPIHVRLGDAAFTENADWWDAVLDISDEQGTTSAKREEVRSLLSGKLEEGHATLYLDGLDEVAESDTQSAIATIKLLEKTYARAQIVVTCRAGDFEARNITNRLQYTRLRLLPFTLTDAIDYVERWYSQMQRLNRVVDAQARKRNLQDALRNSIELAQLASTPLILNLMAIVHTSEGELPRSRSVLYHRTVSHLLAESPHWRRALGSLTISQSELQPLAAEVAYELHSRELEHPNKKHGLTFEDLEAIVRARSSGALAVDSAAYQRASERVVGIVQRLVHSNGLLVEVAKGQFGFSHRSLQEFLAGLHMLDLADVDKLRVLATQSHWREPLILMAGYGGREGSATYFIATLINELVSGAAKDTENGVRLAILTGEMLAEIGEATLRARSQGWVIDRREGGTGLSTWDHVSALIWDATNQAKAVERIALLRVLGRLGDRRIVNRDRSLVPFTQKLAFLPTASVDIGDNDPLRPKPKSELVETTPVRRLTFPAFHVPRYLVTNVEFSAFVEAEGYSDRSLWTDEGWQWLANDASFRSRLESKTREWIERDFGPELEMGNYRLEDVLSNAREMSQARREPFFWRNERYNQPTQPVVGVNLWEAMAYCVWLERQLKRDREIADDVTIRLPTEWEWERAARGSGAKTRYPWGDEDLSSERAHTREAKLALDCATPVGSFPLGQSDHGLLDIAGNAWEWTISRAVSPSEEFDDVRNNISGICDVVVRGGSWFSDEPQSVRCGYRGIDLPQNVYFDVGFRPFAFNYQPGDSLNAIERETVRRKRSSGRYQSQ